MADLSLNPVYLSARAAIVAPERAIPTSLYAVQKWIPRLGPQRWCLIMFLRGLCIDTPRQGNGTKQISCTWSELAEILDTHQDTLASWFKHEPILHDDPWRKITPVDEKAKFLSLFIPRLRYAYETHNGKGKRAGFILEILMEDPIIPEDEVRLQRHLEMLALQQGQLDLITETKNVNPENMGLQFSSTAKNTENTDLQEIFSHSVNVNVNVNVIYILIKRLNVNVNMHEQQKIFKQIVELTEKVLEDDHSTAFFHLALNALCPNQLDLYITAMEFTLKTAETDARANKGKIFVGTLKKSAQTAGVDLGLKSTNGSKNGQQLSVPKIPQISLDIPAPTTVLSAEETIWNEARLALRHQMTRSTYDSVIKPTTFLEYKNNHYMIGVHTFQAKEWLEKRLLDIVERTLSSIIGEVTTVEFKLLVG